MRTKRHEKMVMADDAGSEEKNTVRSVAFFSFSATDSFLEVFE